MLPGLLPAPPGHPYLVKTGIAAHGALLDRQNLAIPMYGIDGALRGYEYVGPAGDKWRLTGTDPKGAFHVFGNPGPELIICEGFATGASIHQATGKAVIAAFNAGNLKAVAVAWRGKLPGAKITIAADNDKSGTGQKEAKEAAKAVGGRVVMPPNVETDFNDLHQAEGFERVRSVIEGLGWNKGWNIKKGFKSKLT